MNIGIGLLWYDGRSGRCSEQKIAAAMCRYVERFGVVPDACYVNPADVAAGVPDLAIRVLVTDAVRPGHIWVGVTGM